MPDDPAAHDRAAAWLKTLPPPLAMKDRGPEGCWTTEERIARAAAREATARAWQTAPPDVLRTLEAAGVVSPWRPPRTARPVPPPPFRPGPDVPIDGKVPRRNVGTEDCWRCGAPHGHRHAIDCKKILAEGDDGWEVGEPDARLRARLIAVAAELLLRDDPDLDAVAVTLCAVADEVGAVEAERDGLRNCPPRWLESHP